MSHSTPKNDVRSNQDRDIQEREKNEHVDKGPGIESPKENRYKEMKLEERTKQIDFENTIEPEKNAVVKDDIDTKTNDDKINNEEQTKRIDLENTMELEKNAIIKDDIDDKTDNEERTKQIDFKKIIDPEKNIIIKGDLARRVIFEEPAKQIGVKKTRLHKVEHGAELEQPEQCQDPLLMRRIRVNRIIMRKRRHERFYSSIGSRLVIAGFIVLAIAMIFMSSGGGVAYAYYQSQLPLLNGIAQHSLFQTTHIYDRNGKLLYELYDKQLDHGRRTYVNYDDISPLLVNATIAAEDHTFWTNTGVDYTGIVRAAVSNAQSNSVVEGGSTITQQLIKKQFFADQPRNVQVKGEEAVLATGLTQQYPKWKIMEMYLNTVFYGDNNFGIEAAAEEYFGLKPQCSQGHCKPAVAQLTLGQASLLAGLPQSPTAYMPVTYKARALARQSIVLQSMLNLNMINARQKAQARKEMQQYQFKGYQPVRLAPHFVDYVVDDVLNLFGAQNVANGGYDIYTTLDLDLEQKVEQLTYDHLYKDQIDAYLGYGTLSQFHNVNNAAVVVMNPVNGEILAMNGSADYNMNSPQVQGQYNAALSPRQPGSSFKPIVYATAFEMGWYPAMIVPDQQTYFPDGTNTYSPHNYDNKYNHPGPMTVRKAVANSFNVPAIEAIEYAGIPNVLNMAGRLGLSEIQNLSLSDTGPSMALGSKETSLLHLTGAYATFANNGVRTPTVSILKINDNQGHTVYQYDDAHPYGQRAVRQDISFLVSSMLSDKVARYEEFGPNNPLELSFPAAAKTGTTDNYADNWTMGYTPHLTVGVWAGNSNNELMRDVIGITGAAPIWHDVMDYASQRYHLPPDDFTPPANVHQKTVSAITGLAAHPGEPTVQDWFIDGTQPTLSGTYYAPPSPAPEKHKHNDNNNGDNNNNNGDNNNNNNNGN